MWRWKQNVKLALPSKSSMPAPPSSPVWGQGGRPGSGFTAKAGSFFDQDRGTWTRYLAVHSVRFC